MEAQPISHPIIANLFQRFNPHPSILTDLNSFLAKECKRNVDNTTELFNALENSTKALINFDYFCKIIRLLRRIVIPLKSQGLSVRLSKYIISHASLQFPIANTITSPKFNEFLKLFTGLTVQAPQNLNDLRQVIIYLKHGKADEEWTSNLLEKISNEVLVDKKNQQAKALKVNQYFSSFIVANFDKLVPNLERLLVRSESNIEVWEDFFTSVGVWTGIDSYVVPLLQKIKHLFINNAEISIKIVVALTRSMKEEKYLKDFITFLSGLISNEQNVKRKVVYIKMLRGVTGALGKHPEQALRNIYAQQILVVLTNSLIKFIEEEDFNILIGVIDVLCPLVSDPKDDIAKAGKIYLKNQNKYIFILFSTIIASVYRKEHVDRLPSVKEIFTHYKAQLNNILKTNWQSSLPVLHFLSEYDLQFVDNLSEGMPLFKVSCLTLSKIEKKVGFKLILKYMEYIKQSEDEELSNNVYAILVLLLEQIKDRKTWEHLISALDVNERVKIVSRGIFPLTLFPCHELKINKGNSFTSLLLFIYRSFQKQEIAVPSGLDFIRSVIVYSTIRPSLKNILRTEEADVVEDAIRRYVNSSLFDSENDEENVLTDKEKSQIELLSNEILTHHQDYLMYLLQQFTNEEYYKKNLEFLQQFEQQVLNSIGDVRKELEEVKGELVERSIYKPEDVKPKKVYIGITYEVKMMSEQEVKEEKYHKHFLKMLAVFDKITAKLLVTLNSHQLVSDLWRANLKSILAVTKFPEHRLSVQKLVKRSFLFTAWFNSKSPESRVFSKHSSFLGELFAFRHSKITPSVKTMAHCEDFLKELLAIPFENGQDYRMLESNEQQFVMLFVNEMCEYLLQNMEFDVNLKKHAIFFYQKCIQKGVNFGNHEQLFTLIANNINILASSEHIQTVLLHLLEKVDKIRIKQLFNDILNYIQATKRLILHTLIQFQDKYRPEFEEFIKLRILALESNAEISSLANQILAEEGELKKSILGFNMKNFVKKNSKETIEKLCIFIKEEITPETVEGVFHMVIRASEELFDEGFDQEGLEMFPFFLNINIDYISEPLYKPIFELLILKFTAKEEFGTLTKLSVDVGISIIKRNAAQHAEKLLLVLESFINKATGVSNIIYLGVLAPYLEGNKNLQLIEKRITELFQGNKEAEQRAISKCMPDLMSFFKQPLKIVEQIYTKIGAMTSEALQIGQSYLFSGLLKGIGYNETQSYLDKIIASTYVAKTKSEKLGRIYLINALVENFGRVVELKGVKIISIMLAYMADSVEEIRNVSKKVGQSLIVKMSSYSVKILLPQLLKGLEEEQNWRIKISYIWILGIMANCSARQLQTSLPIIVPTLSTCLSNAHPTIREKASQALNLIGETIKNPEISQCVDILIEALENPFENSERALEILLKTSFSHFIDPPSLSMIIPILDYCMRGRVSDLKAGSCQVIGSIVELIANPYDLLPYLKIIITGLRVALCDPLPQIRSIAAMAIGRISTKIGIKEAEIYFKFVLEIIESPLSNTTERQGAAQAYAEIVCSQTYQYFEESLYKIFEKLNSIKHSEKEGYILVFLYVPSIRTQEFEGFIKEVNENMYCFVSDEEESIRNSAMMVERVLINNYCLSHTDLLLDPLCNGVFENNWKKRNSALVLIGEMLNIIKSHMYNTRSNEKNYAYYRGLMAVYVIKDDELEMPRLTANQVWNAYIENTPKTIKLGLQQLAKMWTRWTHSANGVVFKNIIAFSSKYGQNYFPEILEFLEALLKEPDHQVGVFQVLTEFIKRLNLQYLSKESFRQTIRAIFSDHLYTIPESVRPSLARCLALFIDKLHEEAFFEDLLYSTIEKMDHTDETNEEYTKNLHLLKDLLQTNSSKVVDRVINKVMEAPMSEFKIEVITNNAERLANYLYSHFKVPATELFIEEIYVLVEDKARENRLSLIIYCLEQVSLQLNKKNKVEFIKMVNSNISKGINRYAEHTTDEKLRKTLQIFINMLLFFLNSTQISEIDELESIIGQLSPLIFFHHPVLRSLGHKIFLLLISDNKSQRTASYIRQMVVSLENNITSEAQVIWEDEVTFKDYVNMLVKGIAYGREDIMEESLDMFEFIMAHTPKELVEREILRIVGPIIRISNYPLLQKQKIRIMELLISILRQSYRIDAYNNQILSVCLRILQQFKNSEDVMRVVADTYLALLTGTSLKQELVLTILSKLKTFGANLVHSFYYMVKSIILQNLELPKNLYDKIYQECMVILLTNEGKLPIKGLYYASKIAARLAVFLGRSIERAEANLKGVTCSYQSVIHYLHFAYYKKIAIGRQEAIEIYLKQSNREKVHYLLKSLKLCIKNAESSRKTFSLEYIKAILPENIIGFDDISDLIDYFESERAEQIPDVQINQQ